LPPLQLPLPTARAIVHGEIWVEIVFWLLIAAGILLYLWRHSKNKKLQGFLLLLGFTALAVLSDRPIHSYFFEKVCTAPSGYLRIDKASSPELKAKSTAAFEQEWKERVQGSNPGMYSRTYREWFGS